MLLGGCFPHKSAHCSRGEKCKCCVRFHFKWNTEQNTWMHNWRWTKSNSYFLKDVEWISPLLSPRVGNMPTKWGCTTCCILWMVAARPRSSEQTMWVPRGFLQSWCVNTLTVKHRNTRPRLQEAFIVNGFFCFFDPCVTPSHHPLHTPQQLTHSSDTFVGQETIGQLWHCG